MNRSRLLIILITAAFASGIISYFVTTGCLKFGYCLVAEDSSKVTMIEALGFAGTMATILAFVATFAIALMAIDAFAISSTVRRGAENIDRFSDEVDDIEKRLKSVSTSISVFELLIKEIDEASEHDDHIYSLFEMISRGAGTGEATNSMILSGRNSARNRRTRIDGIRCLASLKFDGASPSEISSALPELINLARSGDESALWILSALKDLNVAGIPDDLGKKSKKRRYRPRPL